MGGGTLLGTEVVEEGADEACAELTRIEQVMKNVGRGGLTIGACDAGKLELACRVKVKGCGSLCQGDAGMANVDPRHTGACLWGLL